MNKGTNRRALAVYLVVCLLYVSVGFRIPEKLSMKRIGVKTGRSTHAQDIQGSAERNLSADPTVEGIIEKVATPPPAQAVTHQAGTRAAPAVKAPLPTAMKNASGIEPHFLISIPVTCYAVREGWVDRDALIFSKKTGQNSIWLKPLDILKQQDEDGLKSLVTLIGKNRLKEFFKKEAVDIKADLSPEDMMLGRGYTVEKKKLLSMYNRFVQEDCIDLFPVVLAQGGVIRNKEGFQFVTSTEAGRMRKDQEEEEWRMPNLSGLPIKVAIDRLVVHTAKIKVHGNGVVVDQSPKPFERLKGDSACAVYGRLAGE